jgi:hypothetical protein
MSPELLASVKANVFVLVGILLVMLSFYGHAVHRGSPKVLLYTQYKSTACCFWFFFAALCCLLLGYLHYYSAKQFRPDDLLANVALEIVGDLASLFTLAAAWAYSRADKFSLQNTLVKLGIAAGFLALWYLGWLMIAPESWFFVSLRGAPGIALSIVATVALGWAFFVRWGGLVGGVFLLIRFGYGVLQLPGNLRMDVAPYLKDSGGLDISFAWLAAGKVLLAIAFLALLCRSDSPGIAIATEQLAPLGPVHLEPRLQRNLLLDLVIAIVLAFIAAILTDFTCSNFPWCVWRH